MALIMMIKFAALSVLIEYKLWPYIMMAPVAARLLVVALIGFTPIAPSETLAHEFRIEFPYIALFIWLLMALPGALVVGIPMFAMFVMLIADPFPHETDVRRADVGGDRGNDCVAGSGGLFVAALAA